MKYFYIKEYWLYPQIICIKIISFIGKKQFPLTKIIPVKSETTQAGFHRDLNGFN